MSFISKTIAAAAVIFGLTAPATAQTIPQSDLMSRHVTVMVFSDDADQDTVPRDNRIFNRVIARVQEAMNLKGFQVYDETAMTMGYTQVHRVRRLDAEFLEIARHTQIKMNFAVIFQIYASVVRGDYSPVAMAKVRIAGRILNVQTGQFAAAFEVRDFDVPQQPLPVNCNSRDCLLEHVGDHADEYGTALGDVLADKLAAFVLPSNPQITGQPQPMPAPAMPAPAMPAPVAPQPAPVVQQGNGCAGIPDTYILRFREFDPQQINQFESLLASFGCYTHHATVRSMPRLVEFSYDTSSGDARLSRNLRLLLDYAGTNGTVSQNGNVFEVTQVRTR